MREHNQSQKQLLRLLFPFYFHLAVHFGALSGYNTERDRRTNAQIKFLLHGFMHVQHQLPEI